METSVLLYGILFLSSLLNFNKQKIEQNDKIITYKEKRIISQENLKKIENWPLEFKSKYLKEKKEGVITELFVTREGSVYKQKEISKNIIEMEREVHFMTTTFFKDYDNKTLLISKKMKGNTKIIKEKFHDYQWKMMEDKKLINGMSCRKAIGIDFYGRKIEAWFDDSFKIFDGPSEYSGLPGLIISLKTKYKTYEFVSIKELDKHAMIEFPKLENVFSRKEYNEKFTRKKYNNGPEIILKEKYRY